MPEQLKGSTAKLQTHVNERHKGVHDPCGADQLLFIVTEARQELKRGRTNTCLKVHFILINFWHFIKHH